MFKKNKKRNSRNKQDRNERFCRDPCRKFRSQNFQEIETHKKADCKTITRSDAGGKKSWKETEWWRVTKLGLRIKYAYSYSKQYSILPFNNDVSKKKPGSVRSRQKGRRKLLKARSFVTNKKNFEASKKLGKKSLECKRMKGGNRK